MSGKQTASFDVHDLSAVHLTPETFEPIYNTVVGLKFPMEVARVLELRYLINQAVDSFPEPAPTADYREFREALQTVIDATGIENKRHSERMLRILCMLRELHYVYSVNTRDAENGLRANIAANREKRRRAIRNALGLTLAAILSGIAWLGLSEPPLSIQLLTAAFTIGVLLSVRTLPALDRNLVVLEKRMNQLQRHRVKSIHWRMLVHKLALLLGFKRNSEVEVFVIDTDHYDYPNPSRLHH